MSSLSLLADHVWLDGRFAASTALQVDSGKLHAVPVADAQGERIGRFVVPGMPNLHSHAFQRAMAGLAERRSLDASSTVSANDSFWTWREVMYAFAGCIGPADLQAIAAQLYVEMLKAGYTQVCEFHYLHHQPDGRPYADPAAMSLALIEAARDAGIGLTLLPTLYMSGGFDGRALSERQRRFGHEVDAFLRLVDGLRALESPLLRVGIALHSLRAVPPTALDELLASGLAGNCPIHIHIAEQIGEVQDCLAIRKARPVEWLLDHAPVDARWCLVHATHLTADETRRLAASGAIAGLCPTTEANLGDGLFPLRDFLDATGVIGIGSDSHISVSPVEELRWLEYGQRLVTRHRNVSASAATPSTGECLFAHALVGGAQASGMPIGRLDAARADLLVLEDAAPLLAGRDAAHAIDTWLFAGNANLVRDVMVAGRWQVRGGHHHDEERIAARYRTVVERLVRRF
ncbi:formimidoylglutamate deiminase [Dokdonella sp.]|uniref:formimidoylglutamate deiminase n=1 Tax=Dokdonella sp. TaxID=2291710 RepID=UPI0025B85058|nr:formimidoylglutamate deiminase [Dokdonella sp.]MBX3688087.1 formimidoylglutamate deiminase [Dokdonella sp.]